jgi:hypothetical protein
VLRKNVPSGRDEPPELARLLVEVDKAFPRLKVEKGHVAAALCAAADWLGEAEEIRAVTSIRVFPPRLRGWGIAVITSVALIVADAHPVEELRSARIELAEITSVHGTGGSASSPVVVTAQRNRLELGNHRVEDGKIVLDLLHEYAPAAQPPEWVTSGAVQWADLGPAWDYLGGLSAIPNPLSGLSVTTNPAGIIANTSNRPRIHIPWAEVNALAVEGSQQVQSRITVTRLLASGPLALGWRKRLTSAFLVVELRPFGEVVFSSPRFTEPQLRARLSNLMAHCNGVRAFPGGEEAPPAPASFAQRIRELASLHADGILTDEEFATKKAELLREM